MMPPRVTKSSYAEEQLRKKVEGNADDWETRKVLARYYYDDGNSVEAAELIWNAPEIPSVDFEIAFAARILAKGNPRRAIRLLNAVLENNKNHPVQNLGLANALLHHGMVMQAARFYGAATEADEQGNMLNPDLEHFLLWIDDKEKLWGDFEGTKDELDELPWMNRGADQAKELRMAMKGHTTPVRIRTAPPIKTLSLPPIPIEEPRHSMYVQSSGIGDEPSPPPAVTIPMDRVAEKDRIFDEKNGAESTDSPTARNGNAPKEEEPSTNRSAASSPYGSPKVRVAAPAPSTPKPVLTSR